MPVVVRRRHLHNRIAELEGQLGMETTEVAQPSRLSKLFVRHESAPVVDQVDAASVTKKAVAALLEPARVRQMTPIERAQVEPVMKAVQWASGWSERSATPIGAREMRATSAAIVARRAADQLAPASSITPLDIVQAMEAQGVDWVLPFPPGKPLVPYYGYGRRPRQYNYQTARNTTTTTRPTKIPYRTLLELWKSYDVAQVCYRYSASSLASMRVRFQAMEGYGKNPVKEIEEAKRIMRRPDGKRLFRSWLKQNQRNLWIFDSAPIFRLKDKAGRLEHLLNFSAMTLAPMLDYFGDFPDAPAPAFQQFITGIPWDWLTWDDVIYEPFWPETDSPYGTPPLETVLINANCYSDDTEVLTDRGWLRFADVDIAKDKFATRNPDTARFEWQSATKYHEARSDGTMYRSASKNVDVLVTGGHRLLVDRLPKGCPGVKHGNEWLVHAEDLYEYQSALPKGGAGVRCPATSAWDAPDLEWFSLPTTAADLVLLDGAAVRVARGARSVNSVAAQAGVSRPTLRRAETGERLRRSCAEAICNVYGLPLSVIREDPRYFSEGIEGDDFAAFMGMYLSEGCVRSDGPNIAIAQEEYSKGYVEFRDLLARMLGREAPYHRGAFTFGHTALADYLRPFGKAHEKYVPREVLDMSRRQLEIFWRFYVLGDGAIYPRTEIVTTVSKRMADGLQEVLQKIGYSASVRPVGTPAKSTHHQRWQVQRRLKEAYRVDVERVDYEGKVYCVSVPNKTLYVRRNGYPTWCANTDLRLQLFFLDFFCYDDKTEVLTRQGWRKFADLDGSEEYAARSPEGRFEWQRTTDGQVHRFDYEGDLVRFHSNCVDQLVTPNHRMLVRRVPATPASPRNPSNNWHIRRADYFVEHPTAEFHVPLTSEWEGTDPGAEIVLTADAAKRGRPQEVRMPSWAWAEFLGLFIAEGWCRKDRRDVLVSQFPNGDLDEVRRILKNTGLNWLYSPSNGTFSCSTNAIWTALQEVGDGAPNKRIPTGAMEWTPRLLRHLLRGLIIGDGHVTPSGQKVYTTTSRVLADQVQELWQKIGTYARVDTYEPDPRTFAKLVQYKVRTNPKEVFRVPRPTLEPYRGKVSCVSVPNGIIFVRRNGQAMWCGNTKGQVPEAIAIAPEYMTSADDLADFQEQYNTETYGDQSKRWGLKWLPHGTELDFYKPMAFDPELAEYVMRRTVAAHLLTPQNLGILATVNRAAATTQVDQEFRVSTLPTVGYYEDILDSVLQDTCTLPVQMRFDTGREKEDRLTDVQAWSIGIQFGMVGATEGREKLFGLPTDPEERLGRGMLDNRLGFIPAAHMMAVQGEIDFLTGLPKAGTVKPIPYQLPGAGVPVPAEGPYSSGALPQGAVGGTLPPQTPAGGGARPKGDPTKAYPRPLLSGAAKSAQTPDEPLGVQARQATSPEVAEGYGRFDHPHGSGANGTGAVGSPEMLDEAEDLRKWQRQSRRRVADGRSPRVFASDAIRTPVAERVWKALEGARDRETVDAAFKQTGPLAGGLVVQAEDTGRVLLIQRSPDKHDPGEAYCRWEFPGGKLTGQDPWTGARREWEEETGADLPQTARHVGNWTSPDGVYVGFVLMVARESEVQLHPQPEEVSDARWWTKDDLDDPAVRDKVTEILTRVTPLLKGWAAKTADETGHNSDGYSPDMTVAELRSHLYDVHQFEWKLPQDRDELDRIHAEDHSENGECGAHDQRTTGRAEKVRHGLRDRGGRYATEHRVRWEQFHRHTDRFVGHYTPLIQSAMAARVTRAAVDKITERSYRAFAKVANLRKARTTTRPTIQRIVSEVSAGGAASAAAGAVGALAATIIPQLTVAGVVGSPAVYLAILCALYADGYLQGAHEAAQAAKGSMPSWTIAAGIPDSYWSNPDPQAGVARAAQAVAGGGLARLLTEANVTVKGTTDTQLDRIADAIAKGILAESPIAQVEAQIAAIIDTAAKANEIAETEYTRAMGVAQMDVYRANGVAELEWLHVPGACGDCMANVAASPQPAVAPQWPSGPLPVHPHERCAVAPYYGSLTGGQP